MSTITSWPKRTLEDVASIERKSVQPQDISNGTTYVGLENITSNGSFLGVQRVENGDIASNKFAFTKDHVLYGKLRPYLAKIAIPNFEGICSTDILPIRAGRELDTRFLLYFLRQPDMVEYATQRCTGANLPRLSPKELAAFKIPLPPLSEQKRIADILDKADAIRRKRQQAIEIKEALISSTFLEMFGDPVANPQKWNIHPFQQVTSKINDGTHKTPRYQNDGVIFISAKNVKGSAIDWVNTRFISEAEHEQLFRRCNPERGDVLLCKSGTIGRAAEVVVNFPFSLFESLALIKLDKSKLRPTFVVELLNCEAFQRLYLKGLKGVGVKHLHLTDIRKIDIICPPIDVQDKFIFAVDRLRSQECNFSAAASDSNDLFNSLVQLAFKGKL